MVYLALNEKSSTINRGDKTINETVSNSANKPVVSKLPNIISMFSHLKKCLEATAQKKGSNKSVIRGVIEVKGD